MKKLLFILSIGIFSVSCGPSICDCAQEKFDGEMSEKCQTMFDGFKELKGEARKAKKDEWKACLEDK